MAILFQGQQAGDFTKDRLQQVVAFFYGDICRQAGDAELQGCLGLSQQCCEIFSRMTCDEIVVDVDLGFTPATNTNAIKRLSLEIGAEVETTAVWLDIDDWSFKPLRQIYKRLSATELAYCSPSHEYDAILQIDDFDIIRHYPALWKMVSGPDLEEH